MIPGVPKTVEVFCHIPAEAYQRAIRDGHLPPPIRCSRHRAVEWAFARDYARTHGPCVFLHLDLPLDGFVRAGGEDGQTLPEALDAERHIPRPFPSTEEEVIEALLNLSFTYLHPLPVSNIHRIELHLGEEPLVSIEEFAEKVKAIYRETSSDVGQLYCEFCFAPSPDGADWRRGLKAEHRKQGWHGHFDMRVCGACWARWHRGNDVPDRGEYATVPDPTSPEWRRKHR